MTSFLIITSCGKAKSISHPAQPRCQDLVTEEQREEAIKRFSSMLMKAKDLYIGGQAIAIKRAVKILRLKDVNVDYFILSAGFGLVNENTLLPPYECSFGGGKRAIQQRANELKIKEKLEEIKLKNNNYDYVYLALGKNYLTALGDLTSFVDLGKVIIFFGTVKTNLPVNFQLFDSTEFMEYKSSLGVFKVPLGATIKVKGTLLENYSLDYKKGLSFKEWWEKKRTELIKSKSNLKQTTLMINSQKRNKPSLKDNNK